MRTIVTALLLTHLLVFCSTTAHTEVRISNDLGGKIIEYYLKYEVVRQLKDRVVIDGPCLSACTLVLGIVPRERICVTERAVLGFHAAWVTDGEKRITSPEGTKMLWNVYPPVIKKWIGKAGLTPVMLYLKGPKLTQMYPLCKNSSADQIPH